MNLPKIPITLLGMSLISVFSPMAMGTQFLQPHPSPALAPPFTVQEFLHQDNSPFYLREPIEESLSERDLPYLYDVVRDTDRQSQWDHALLAICVLEEGPRALETVVEKTTKPWNWTEHVYKDHLSLLPLEGRVRYLWNVSMIDPALGVPFLSSLLSPEGARAFLESWGALPLPTTNPHEIDFLIGSVQRAAAYGLIYTRSPTAIPPITAELQRQAALTDPRGYWTNLRTVLILVEALGVYDLLEVRGWEGGMRALRHDLPGVGFGIAHPYVEKRLEEVTSVRNTPPRLLWKRVVVRHQTIWLGFGALIVAGGLGSLTVRRMRHRAKPRPQDIDRAT